jgi:hypothetical protein
MFINQRNTLMPALFVLGTGAATVLLCGVLAYSIGVHVENQRQFLPNYRPANVVEAQVEITMRYACNSSEANDVLLLGDSAMRCGLDTPLFESLTGTRAYNLATAAAMGVDGNELVLRKYLEHHPKPRVVVFGAYPWCIAWATDKLSPLEHEVRDAFFWTYLPYDEANRPRHAAPLEYYASQGVRNLYGFVTGGAMKYSNDAGAGYPKTFNSLSAAINARRGHWQLTGEMVQDEAPPAIPEVSSAKRDALVHLADFCASEGISMLICTTPLPDALHPDLAELSGFFQEITKKSPAARIHEPMFIRFSAEKFFDSAHCNAAGAADFTRIIADSCQSMLGSPFSHDQPRTNGHRATQ